MVSFIELSPWLQRFEAAWRDVQDRLYNEPTRLHAACRYALAGQGKRIRPLLAMAAAEAVGSAWDKALPAAMALEFVHTYSLVHDDLPCMDDDDMRRGRATTHKVFDEATALLVGDALLTDSFQILLQSTHLTAAAQVELVRALSEAAGGRGMVYGQDLDMHWTGRSGFTAQDLDAIHSNKTGALIAAACAMGAIAGEASADGVERLRIFGSRLGLAFQIIDDLLDNSAATGKSQGKDAHSGKLTYLTIMSHAEASARAERLTTEALQDLLPFGEKGKALHGLAVQLLQRTR
ncbi:polyprenyl synthetase family protein [Oligoflexus tunisiensis]|uniref:polyprenyl synthetase family protein n=1 Tax=Oligoflexus tunisiensis TaxID=708132 RepID=UPI000A4DC15E|nr:farnesyl diphosphate synthase [Oligoflexus tunisiensis]